MCRSSTAKPSSEASRRSIPFEMLAIRRRGLRRSSRTVNVVAHLQSAALR
jgi:hypothetical protein